MIDTHCHLDSERFDSDRAQVLERAFAAGVEEILIPGVGPSNWEALLSLAKTNTSQGPRITVGLGIHPQLLPDMSPAEDEQALQTLDTLLAQGGAVAVGECGLDGPSLVGAPLERQLFILRQHFALARKHQLPLIVHCHRLHPALIQLLETEAIPERGAVLHSYSGGLDLAKVYAQWGSYFSFAGPVTYAEARKPLASLKAIGLERLLLETDGPDQAPAPHRGHRSEPAYVQLIAEAIARQLGCPFADVVQATTQNAKRLFGGSVVARGDSGEGAGFNPSPSLR